MTFLKYQHVEKWGHTETEGIEDGVCYIFPKLDGTNASVWHDGLDLAAGSRNRQLAVGEDNAGFLAWVLGAGTGPLGSLFQYEPTWHLYGEWLVPHTLKTYREEAWRKFYVFDVYCHQKERLLSYNEYESIVRAAHLDLVDPLCIITNPTEENIIKEVSYNNTYLIQDGQGVGEGVVVKNYSYLNKFGRQPWAKFVRAEFKEQSARAFGICEKTGTKVLEAGLAEKFVTQTLVSKTRAKVELELRDGYFPDWLHEDEFGFLDWLSQNRGKVIGPLLGRVYHDLVTEEIWAMLKFMGKGQQVIDFKQLSRHCTLRVKEHAKDLF